MTAWIARLKGRRWGLSSQMVLWSLGLLLLIQAAVYLAVQAATRENAQITLAQELAVADRVWARLLEQRAAKLTQGASVLAADFGFREAVSSDDAETIRSALDNLAARIDASIIGFADPRMQPRIVSGTVPGIEPALPAVWRSLAPALSRDGRAVGMVDGKPYQFVVTPVRAPALIGTIVMGFEIGTDLMRELGEVAGLDATLVGSQAGGGRRLLHTSLTTPPPLAALPADGRSATLELAGVPHLMRPTVVVRSDAGDVTLWLSGSLAKALAPYQRLLLALAALTLVGVLLFGAASVWAARQVTRPLRQLVRASERLAEGDYETPVDNATRQDEVGELALAFERMRTAIGANEREIRHLAFWDRLTDLPNRLQFRDAVQAELAAGHPTAVIMLDLDRFKHVNDVLGYAFGDRLLKALGQRLQAAARPGDLVARLGGDEFALLLSGADAATAQAVAAQLQEALSRPLSLEDQRVDLGAGLGLACAPDHANDADMLLSRAEVAMYAAKRGKAGARLYEPALDNASVQTLSLLSELREAVDGGQLRLFVQPKMRVDTGELCGGEALVRWMHPTRGLVPPMQFIPFAEQTGFIRELTLWVFEEAARQQSRLRACGVKRLSLNLSTRDLMDIELPERFAALLNRHGAHADELCLEITESAIMDDPDRAEATLNRLAECGYKLSIDDFGTGYSSLAYLRRLPVQELKIDKSFVMSMQAEAGQAQIVRSTIDLAHNLGLSVVAEGVENAGIMTLLNELHCDEAQGYHLGKPMPMEQFEQRFGPSVAAPSAREAATPAAAAAREASPA